MRVLIVDDEPAARSRLARLIEEIDATGLTIVGEAGDGLTAIALVRERAPDVVLLDIAMREVDGFDVARRLAPPRPLIIFQTAHHHFAVEAFDHDALDFVVKPVRRERLARAFERARERLGAGGADWDPSAIDRAAAALGRRPVRSSRLLVRHGAGHRLVALADIRRFDAGDGVVYAHLAVGDAPIADYTLAQLEERVGHAFVRVSRGDLVSVGHIRGVASNGDGSLTLTLDDGTGVRVSRRRAADVRQRLA